MKYTIIKNSESHTGYNIPDCNWVGLQNGLVNGWQFEYTNDKGEYGYSSVDFDYGMAEDYAGRYHLDDGTEWIHEIPIYKGWTPTGRVVFRGYYEERYSFEERDTYYVDAFVEGCMTREDFEIYRNC